MGHSMFWQHEEHNLKGKEEKQAINGFDVTTSECALGVSAEEGKEPRRGEQKVSKFHSACKAQTVLRLGNRSGWLLASGNGFTASAAEMTDTSLPHRQPTATGKTILARDQDFWAK